MTRHRTFVRRWGILLAGMGAIPFTAALGWAQEAQPSWRATYDLVMMWVNFGILAFLIAKYARAPLLNLLKGEADKTAAGLKEAQAGKEQADRKVQETLQALENARERLRGVQERIIGEGERQRQRIIDSARHESELLLERTRHKIDSQIYEAHLKLKSELIDSAVAVAMERLPAEITPEDQLRLVERFVQKARSA